tara:strand:- start:580 stop:1149 length:570 start_codon:yes stop_codon:yes gene_type:complete
MAKNTTGDWRKHYHNEYKTGRLSYETKMVQWAHIMMLDEMFECQKRNECLSYKHAVKRYGKKNVDRLIQQDIFRREKSNFNDDVCIYSSQIDTNIIDINHITKVKTEAANIRHYGNPEGKQGLKDSNEPYMGTKAIDNFLKEKQKDKYANDNLLKIQPEVQKLLDAGEEEKNKKDDTHKGPYMGTDFIT